MYNLIPRVGSKVSDWKKFAKTKRPIEIPSHPWNHYKEEGYVDLPDFVGTISSRTKKVRDIYSFDEAKLIAQKNLSHIKSSYEWMNLINQIRENFPKMPKNPINAYKGKGFKDWNDFIGK